MKRTTDNDGQILANLFQKKAAKRPNIGKVHILVDGYYGDQWMCGATLQKMCNAVKKIVEEEWQISWDRVVWVSVSGTWAKAVPLYLMLQGLGSYIEFFLPCQGVKSNEAQLLLPSGSRGAPQTILRNSMNKMQQRLNEDRKAKNVAEHPLVHMKSLLKHASGALHGYDGWAEQSREAVRQADHMIHLPYFAPHQEAELSEAEELKQQNYYGGRNYDAMMRKGARVKQVNLYDVFHDNDGAVSSHIIAPK